MDRQEDGAGFESLMEQVSFELERDLRLHPTKLELGRFELVTDGIRLAYEMLHRHLQDFVVHPESFQREELRAEIKRYLARINANPFFPLQFRLKVLGMLEKHLDLFDVEIASQVLNAHKIGIQLVQREALQKPEYLSPLVSLIANAIELAESILFETLRAHRVPHLMAIRQSLDLMRVGLVVAPTTGSDATGDVRRLKQAIASHELLRCMNLHARNDDEQSLVRKELHRHASNVSPLLFRRGEDLPDGPNVYLATSLQQPHLKPEKLTRLPDKASHDMIVLPLGGFLDAIRKDIDTARRVAGMRAEERQILMTDRRFKEISQGTTVIHQSLQSVSRAHMRRRVKEGRLLVEWRLSEAFAFYGEDGPLLSMEMLGDGRRELWSVVNVSETGLALERMGDDWPEGLRCGAMVGLRWVERSLGPALAVVRWYCESKPGEQRIGLEFVGQTLRPVRGMLLKSDLPGETHRRLTLLRDAGDAREVWFPLKTVDCGDPLIYLHEGEGMRCHIEDIVERGENYSVCRIAFDEDQGGFSVKAQSLL